jgi:hypothetical protein
MEDYTFYDQPLKAKNMRSVDYIVALIEIGFSYFSSQPQLSSRREVTELELVLKNFLTLNEGADLMPYIPVVYQILSPIRYLSNNQQKKFTEEKIIALVQQLIDAIQRYHQICAKGSPKLTTIPPPPPPPIAPTYIANNPPRIVHHESSRFMETPRIPVTTKDPRKELHDELRNGKTRLRVISVQRSVSGTPIPSYKEPQIVTMNDLAFREIRKKFRSQQEE